MTASRSRLRARTPLPPRGSRMDEGARRRLSLPTPMSLLAVLAVFWAVVHALHHVYARRQATKSILPSLTAARRRRLDVTLKHAYLHVETTQFNDAHDRLSLRRTLTYISALLQPAP